MDSLLSVVIMGLSSSEPWPEMLRRVSFPVRSFQFLTRGSSQRHLEPLLPANRLGVAAGAPRRLAVPTQAFGNVRSGGTSFPICILF